MRALGAQNTFMKGDIVVSGIVASTALYALAYSFFWPEKLGLSRKLPLPVLRWLLVAMIVGAVSLALLPVLLHQH